MSIIAADVLWSQWEQDGRIFWQEMDAVVDMLDQLTLESAE